MKVAIVGFDVEGRASFEYFRGRGDDVTICDAKTDLETPVGVSRQLGEGYLRDLDQFDLIVRTAGMHPRVILETNPSVGPKMTSLINEFFAASPTKNIIGVTGTKGKGTTSSLITEMLKATGKDVYLGGNIGLPPLTFLADLTPESWVVLELSSFQLIDIKYSPHIAVCLMVAPEHLNWHRDMEEYVTAKAQLFTNQLTIDSAVYFGKNELSTRIASAGGGQKVPYFTPPGAVIENNRIVINGQEVVSVDEVKLLGAHNLQNSCAAVTAVWEAGIRDILAMRQVLTSFAGLEHRLELVRELDGITYYDDSFGTTPETAIVAIEAFKQPKVIILGGSDKGAGYDELAHTVANGNVRQALLIGDQAGRIQAALEAAGFTDFVAGGETMQQIVAAARAHAQPGDVVLLSTGCASFGLFQNYKDRGNQFKTAVLALR